MVWSLNHFICGIERGSKNENISFNNEKIEDFTKDTKNTVFKKKETEKEQGQEM